MDPNTLSTGILKFTADWCGPCQKIKPFLHDLEHDMDIPVISVDVDENDDLRNEYGVTAMPTIVFLYNRIELSDLRVVGANTNAILESAKVLKKKIDENQIHFPLCMEARVECPTTSLLRKSKK